MTPTQRKLVVAGGILILAAGLAWQFGHLVSLAEVARREDDLRAWVEARPVTASLAAGAIYVAITGLSLPGAAAMTLAFGWLFGFVWALVLVSFSSTTGATLAFLLSRYLFRDAVERRFGTRIAGFNEALRREGALYLFTLRLIPAVPFFVINLVMGLTPLAARTFWWVSQLGMLPGTAVYVWAGASVPSLAEFTRPDRATPILSPQLLVAFALLGLLPLVLKKVVAPLLARRGTVAVG